MIKGAYIHIPFCEHICYYCDFNKYFLKNQPVDDYLQALDREMALADDDGIETCLETIFVGGGTPTALNARQMAFFLESVKTRLNPHDSIKEWTMEANPENMDEEKLALMKQFGVNRLSIGVQTFNDRLLKAIGRAHDRASVLRAFRLARRIGFDNVSLDLMFGLPGQTAEDLKASLKEACALEPEHLSIYSLQIEPRTIFYNRLKNGTLKLPDQDMEAEMYEYIMDFLDAHGYKQYEISNFTKPGFESRHNLLYWNNEEYYGFGAGSHGYVQGERVVNAGAVKGYIRRIRETGSARTASHPVTPQEKMEEEMFLGLRKIDGVSKREFYRKFGRTMHDLYGESIDRLKSKGLLYENDDRIALTRTGLLLGNDVFQEFLLS